MNLTKTKKTKSDEVNTITPTTNKMENIITNTQLQSLQNGLTEFEMIFDENENIRFSEFIGEEMHNKSFEKMIEKTQQFSDREIQTIILPMKRKKQMTKCFDDGWLHLEFPKSLFQHSFQMEMEERFDN